jgi:molybdopterin synthase sulfur carrier subunit
MGLPMPWFAGEGARATQAEVNLAGRLWHHLHMPKIQIPTPLRQYAGKQPAVEVKASTVGEALSGLVTRHPELRRHLYTDEGKLRAFVNVYLNDEDVRYLQKEATAVKETDSISIVPSIAGGNAELTIVIFDCGMRSCSFSSQR